MTDLAGGAGRRFNVGRVIERTFDVTRRNFPVFAGLALLLTGVPQALAALDGDGWAGGLSAFGGLASMVAACMLQAALIQGVVTDLNGRKPTFGECLHVGLTHFLPVLGVTLLATIGVMFGLLLLIAPGVMMAVAWTAAAPAQVIEKRGVFDSFSRSAALTRGSRWAIFGLFVIYLFMLVGGGVAFRGIAQVAAGGLGGAPGAMTLTVVVSPVLNSLLSLIISVGVAAIYHELRMVKEGVGAEDLAAVFD